MALVIMLCLAAGVHVAADFSASDSFTGTAEEASTAASEVRDVCEASAELPYACATAVTITAAYYLVDFAVSAILHHEATQHQDPACRIFASDFHTMETQFKEIVARVRKWRPMIQTGRYGDLFAETVDMLGIGEQFVKDTDMALSDGDKLVNLASSAASRVAPRLIPTAFILTSFFSFGLQPTSGNCGKALLVAAVGTVAVTLQGCDDPTCNPNKAELHRHLFNIQNSMQDALVYIQNLKNCVKDGKPICTVNEMRQQDGHIGMWLRTVKSQMNEVAHMNGMPAMLPAVALQTSVSVWTSGDGPKLIRLAGNASARSHEIVASIAAPSKQSGEKLAVLQGDAPRRLMALLKDFDGLSNAAREKGLQGGGAQEFCVFLSSPSPSLLYIVLGVSIVLAIGGWKIIGFRSGHQADQDGYRRAGEDSAWPHAWIFVVFSLTVASLLSVLVYLTSMLCQASMFRSHDMQMWTSHAQDLLANIRAQLACVRVNCSHHEEEHLQMQFASTVKDTFSASIYE